MIIQEFVRYCKDFQEIKGICSESGSEKIFLKSRKVLLDRYQLGCMIGV
jgi:hypothetical protein